MKTSKIFLFLSLCTWPYIHTSAQQIPIDSLKKIIEQRITSATKKENLSLQLESSYYIEDVSTRESITKKRYGVFEFGLYGDDVDRWIMWYDSSGYKIYGKPLNTAMLGEILDFIERNKYTAAEAFYYIKGLHRSCKIAEYAPWGTIVNQTQQQVTKQ